jgi:UDP-3-O-[3-hydroxymyristoyl] glucosamine N-acyltransferase
MKLQTEHTELESEQIAEQIGGEHIGSNVDITGVNAINSANKNELSFWEQEDTDEIKNSNAACVICLSNVEEISGKTLIKTPHPRIGFLRIVNNYFRKPPEESVIHQSATVADEADIGNQCWIGPGVYIGDRVSIGDRCKVQAGTSIGGEGFAFAPDKQGELLGQIHQGEVIIEDNVEIGSNCSIDRAIFDETVIGKGTKIDNLVHVAHQTVVGENVWIAYNVGLSGSVKIGDRTMIHPNAAVAMRVTVGEDVTIAMNAGVLNDTDSGVTLVGTPAKPIDR